MNKCIKTIAIAGVSTVCAQKILMLGATAGMALTLGACVPLMSKGSQEDLIEAFVKSEKIKEKNIGDKILLKFFKEGLETKLMTLRIADVFYNGGTIEDNEQSEES